MCGGSAVGVSERFRRDGQVLPRALFYSVAPANSCADDGIRRAAFGPAYCTSRSGNVVEGGRVRPRRRPEFRIGGLAGVAGEALGVRVALVSNFDCIFCLNGCIEVML